MSDKQELIKNYHDEIDKHYKIIDGFINYYCKNEEDKKLFYRALNDIIDLNIEIESECNQ